MSMTNGAVNGFQVPVIRIPASIPYFHPLVMFFNGRGRLNGLGGI